MIGEGRGSTEPFGARLHAGCWHENLVGVKVVAVRGEGHVLGGEPTGIMRRERHRHLGVADKDVRMMLSLLRTRRNPRDKVHRTKKIAKCEGPLNRFPAPRPVGPIRQTAGDRVFCEFLDHVISIAGKPATSAENRPECPRTNPARRDASMTSLYRLS